MRILSIDGGGIRGLLAATVLEAYEAVTGRPIWQQFDLIAGTSTGGILAAYFCWCAWVGPGWREDFVGRCVVS